MEEAKVKPSAGAPEEAASSSHAPDKAKRRFGTNAFCAIAALGALFWGFKGMLLSRAPAIFCAKEEDMSFAWYVPLFSLYVLWSERKKIASSLGNPAWGGFLFALPLLAIGLLGARGLQVRFEILAFSGLIIALAWMFFGRKTARACAFPALFLLFCIPLNTYLDVVTVHLRLFATGFAYEILRGVGADVIKIGTMIGAADGSFSIDVAAPCSGLRSIFALLALTAGYAYFNQPTWFRRALLFSCAVPLAILGNVTRILSICLVAKFANPDFATGFYHDYSGYVVFIVAIVLMIAASEAITKGAKKFEQLKSRTEKNKKVKTSATDKTNKPGETSEPKSGVSIFKSVLFLCVFTSAMIFQAMTPEVTITEAPAVRLPETLEGGWNSNAIEPSEAELTVLPADTQFDKRIYSGPGGAVANVTLVIGGKSKSSIHRPELCLPSQGYQMVDPRTLDIDGIEWRFIKIRTTGYGETALGYTFFNQDGYKTVSHMKRIFRDILDRTLYNRVDRWVMVTINTPTANESFFTEFARKIEKAIFIKF